MPAAEPHPRRRVALRRALTIAAVAVLALATPVAAAEESPTTLLPSPTSTEPEPTTTTAPPVQTTTTAAAIQTTTTAARSAPTTARPTPTSTSTTTTAFVTRDDVADDAGTVAEDEPAETTSTARDLLVSGDGTEGAQSSTTTTVVEVAADDGPLDEQAQIWLVVAGLVLVALLIGVWTWRFWVRTRPEAPTPGDEPDPTTVFRRG